MFSLIFTQPHLDGSPPQTSGRPQLHVWDSRQGERNLSSRYEQEVQVRPFQKTPILGGWWRGENKTSLNLSLTVLKSESLSLPFGPSSRKLGLQGFSHGLGWWDQISKLMTWGDIISSLHCLVGRYQHWKSPKNPKRRVLQFQADLWRKAAEDELELFKAQNAGDFAVFRLWTLKIVNIQW